MADFTGKVALVTGGGTGIGRGIAPRFAEQGMKLSLAGLEHARSGANQYGGRHLGGYSAARDVAREGITVNCICPGIVGTQMWTLLKEAFARRPLWELARSVV